MSEASRAIEKTNKNPLLTVKELREVTDAQFNRPGRVQETIKDTPASDGIGAAIEEIDAALNPRLTFEVRAAVAEITHIPQETFDAIGIWSCFTPTLLCQNPELKGQLEDLQRGYDEAMKRALSFTARAAADAYRANLEQCEKTTFETGAVDHCEGKTREAFELEYRHKFESAMKLVKTFAPRARELVVPHLHQYADMVRDLADKEAEKERAKYNLIGMPWEVSPLIATLYRAAEMVLEHNGGGHDPKSVAKFFNFDLEPSEHITFEELQ